MFSKALSNYYLGAGTGWKYIYVWFKDDNANISSSASDSIYCPSSGSCGSSSNITNDTTAPSNGSISISNKTSYTYSSTNLSLSLSAYDSNGVSAYCLSSSSYTPSASSTCWTSITNTSNFSISNVNFSLNAKLVGEMFIAGLKIHQVIFHYVIMIHYIARLVVTAAGL